MKEAQTNQVLLHNKLVLLFSDHIPINVFLFIISISYNIQDIYSQLSTEWLNRGEKEVIIVLGMAAS